MEYSLKYIKRLCSFAKERNFSLPEGFEKRTPQWIRRNFNGIGAEWMPRWSRRFLSKLLQPLDAAAMVHDVEFLQDNKSYWNFTKANFRLTVNCAKSGFLFSGIAAGTICQFFGWTAWKEGKETMIWYYYYQEEMSDR